MYSTALKYSSTSKIVSGKTLINLQSVFRYVLGSAGGDLHCNIYNVFVKCDKNFSWKVIEKPCYTMSDNRGKANPKTKNFFTIRSTKI